MRNVAVLLLILIITISSMVTITTAQQSVIIKPAVPEFTVQIVTHSRDVPTTYSIDPYTGANITHQGYHTEGEVIEIRIKNQPYNPYKVTDEEGQNFTVALYYNYWVKGHFEEEWTQVFSTDGLPRQAPGEYTVFSRPMSCAPGSKIDFKVEAMAGYITRPNIPEAGGPVWTLNGEVTWSNVQTLAINDTSTTPTTVSPPANPQDSTLITLPSGAENGVLFGLDWEQTAIVALAVLVVASWVSIVVFWRKRSAK